MTHSTDDLEAFLNLRKKKIEAVAEAELAHKAEAEKLSRCLCNPDTGWDFCACSPPEGDA